MTSPETHDQPSPPASDIDTRTVAVTFFKNQAAKTLRCEDLTLRQLANRIAGHSSTEKKYLPWLKLAVFGDQPSDKGCLRTNDNTDEVSGIEVEHDAGTVTFDEAVEVIRNSHLRALLYTSPSYQPGTKERWRILLPLSHPGTPGERTKFVARINGLFDGKIENESFTLSQAYLYGSVNNNPAHRVEVIDGDFLDLRDDLEAGAIFKIAVVEGIEHDESEFDKLNTLALHDLEAWVHALFGDKVRRGTMGGYRIKSKDLGRHDLKEDISITPIGITDWGVNDMGDARRGRRGPIGLVMEWGEKDFVAAVQWLADKLGVPPPAMVLNPNAPFRTASVFIRWQCTDGYGRRALHRHRGAFALYMNSHYQLEDNDELVRSGIWRFLDKAKRPTEDKGPQPFNPKKESIANVLDALGAQTLLPNRLDPPFWWPRALAKDKPPAGEFFSCGTGLLHVPTGDLYAATPEYFGVFATEVDFNRAAAEPTQWLAFLDQVLGDDEAIQLAQEWMGYCLTPDTSQQKILYCEGPRRSGKGTFARIITALLGKNSVAGPTLASLGKDFGLQGLIAKPLAIISDARIGQKTDKAAVVERLLTISGEDTISVARKFLGDWDGRLPTRIMMLTNVTPALDEGSGALAGRLLGLIFPNSFYGREDLRLEAKLKTELPGILNWAMAGYRRLHERGHFVQPQNALAQIEQIEILGSPVKAFIRDCCVIGVGQEATTGALWRAWMDWNNDNGHRDKIGSREWFVRNLKTAVPGIKAAKLGREPNREMGYRGVGLDPTQRMSNRRDTTQQGAEEDDIPF